MKLNTVATAAALLASAARAEDVEESKSVPELPTFTPTTVKADFLEQFTSDWAKRWEVSRAKKDTSSSTDEEEWAYVGEWAVQEPHVYKGMAGDEGLVVMSPAAHHAISAKFPKKIDNTDNTLVVQYEVKFQKTHECGGAYLKLLRDNKALHQEDFRDDTSYVIMFGPDKCGHNNKVHLIINHKNPKTGAYEEKHLSAPPQVKNVKTTELYTLIINPNNTYIVKQNDEEVKSGSLFEDFTPSINPAKEIDDPKDTKPETWVDEARIPDPDASKPEDWDEDAPFEIVDEEAEKPADWLENEPKMIPDPEAAKPEDWDDEEDGDWDAPTISNPKCDDVSGCGPWSRPMIKNPAFKGKWRAPLIDNPKYKGVWAPRKIPNPDYFEDKHPSNLEPMGAIGFELWTMQNDILFDNIYIGHSVEDAAKFAQETFHTKLPFEKTQAEADIPAEPEVKSPGDLKFLDDPVLFVKEKADLFWAIAQRDPIEAIKFVPEVAGGIVAVFISFIAIIAALVGLGSSPTPKKAAPAKSTKDEKAKDKSEASATGAEKSGAEATKRTTRSQS